MPDPAEPASQAPQTTRPRTRRTPKFVLPEHHRDEQDDERAAERIEAFIDGPDTTRRRSATVARERRPIELETRPDWTRAVHHEGARHARYGRSASVVLVDLRGLLENGTADRVAARLADAIQGEARETDRATRVGALSFRILLTDTGGRAAKRFAERLDTAFRTRCAREGIPDGMSLCVEIATPARTASLEDALAEAETRLRARTMGSPAA